MRSQIWLMALGGLVLTPASSAARPAPDRLAGYIARLTASSKPEDRELMRRVRNGPADLAREVAAARREGIPLAWKDVAPRRVEADRDAGPDYEAFQAFMLHHDWPMDEGGKVGFPDGGGVRSAATIERIGKDFDALKPARDALIRATDKPAWNLSSGRDPVDDPRFPELAISRNAATYLRYEALERAYQQRYDESVKLNGRVLKIAKQDEKQNYFTAYVSSTGIRAIAFSGLRNDLRIGGDQAAPVVAQVLSKSDFGALLSRVYRNATAENFRQSSYPPPWKAGSGTWYALLMGIDPPREDKDRAVNSSEGRFLRSFMAALQAEYLREMRILITSADGGWQLRQASETQVRAIEERQPKVFRSLTAYTSRAFPVGSIWTANATNRAVVLAAAEVLTYHAKRGSWPASLADAAPDAVDPFTGRILRYTQSGNGFTVESAGDAGLAVAQKKALEFQYPASGGD